MDVMKAEYGRAAYASPAWGQTGHGGAIRRGMTFFECYSLNIVRNMVY